jgi:hypothetical protein
MAAGGEKGFLQTYLGHTSENLKLGMLALIIAKVDR